jgi:senataxin
MALAYHDHATATQSVEPEMAILLRRNIRGLVAIGDPQQLPSVISNQDLRIKGFAISMFERLLKAGSPHTLLDVQYRMDPMISMWPSGAFYNGQIVDGDNVQDLGRSPPWQKASGLMTAPYSFFNIPGVEERNNGPDGPVQIGGVYWYHRDWLCRWVYRTGPAVEPENL